MASIHELCKETDPVLATTRRWVFLLSRSWALPRPEVCLKGCRGVWPPDHPPNPRVPCFTATASGARSSSKEKPLPTTDWELLPSQRPVVAALPGYVIQELPLAH